MIHSVTQKCMILTKGFLCLPLSYQLNGLCLWVGIKDGIIASHNIAKSKTGSKEMQIIHFDQEVQVCGILKSS